MLSGRYSELSRMVHPKLGLLRDPEAVLFGFLHSGDPDVPPKRDPGPRLYGRGKLRIGKWDEYPARTG